MALERLVRLDMDEADQTVGLDALADLRGSRLVRIGLCGCRALSKPVEG